MLERSKKILLSAISHRDHDLLCGGLLKRGHSPISWAIAHGHVPSTAYDAIKFRRGDRPERSKSTTILQELEETPNAS
jgi:hypothetical protein